LYHDGFDASGALKHTTVNVPYAGIMVPDRGTLSGFATGAATLNKQKHAIPVFIW